jgi:hypothetical protein
MAHRLAQSFQLDEEVDDSLTNRITNIEVMVRQIWLALEQQNKGKPNAER